jgi:hypothetical protein
MAKYTLIYGGREFNLGDSDHGILKEPHHTEGTLRMNLGKRGWLTIATGPNIPIAIIEKSDDADPRVRKATIL